MVSPVKDYLRTYNIRSSQVTCALTRVIAVNRSQTWCQVQTLLSSTQQMCGFVENEGNHDRGSVHRTSPSAYTVPNSPDLSVEKGKNEFFRSHSQTGSESLYRYAGLSRGCLNDPDGLLQAANSRTSLGVHHLFHARRRGHAKLLLQYRQNLPLYVSYLLTRGHHA